MARTGMIGGDAMAALQAHDWPERIPIGDAELRIIECGSAWKRFTPDQEMSALAMPEPIFQQRIETVDEKATTDSTSAIEKKGESAKQRLPCNP